MNFLFVSGVAYGDIGGGQQPAQLARQIVRQGHRVYHYQPNQSALCFADGVIEIPCPDNLRGALWSLKAPGAADHWRALAYGLKLTDDDGYAVISCPLPWYVRGAEVLKSLGWKIIYFMVDDWEALYALDGPQEHYRREDERRLLSLADQIFVSAEALKHKTDREVVYLPNGYDVDDFPVTIREPVKSTDRLSILYWGCLRGAWFDWDLFHGLSVARPQWAFHLIGPVPPSPPRLQNVMYHGVAPTHWLSRLARIGDVAVIPFCPSSAIDAVDPVKAYEYLACGLPIVTCRLPQLDGWPGVVQVPNIPVLWTEAIEAAVVRGVDPQTQAAHLQGKSWLDRANAFLAAITRVADRGIVVPHPRTKRGVKDG